MIRCGIFIEGRVEVWPGLPQVASPLGLMHLFPEEGLASVGGGPLPGLPLTAGKSLPKGVGALGWERATHNLLALTVTSRSAASPPRQAGSQTRDKGRMASPVTPTLSGDQPLGSGV